VDPGVVEETVAFASVENLRRMESENYFWRSGSRVQAPDTSNPDSYKVRKAKVGGYRDYFDDAQLALIDAYVDEHLGSGFGYTTGEATQDPATAASDSVTPPTAGEGVSAS
jgi:predicted aconitase